MSWSQIYPRQIAAIFSCFLVLSCTQLPLSVFAACLHLQLCISIRVSRPPDLCPARPQDGLANTLRTCSVFDFPWLVFFPLSTFVVIKAAVVDLRNPQTGFAV